MTTPETTPETATAPETSQSKQHAVISADRPTEQHTICWGDERGNDVFTARQIIDGMSHSDVRRKGEDAIRAAITQIFQLSGNWITANRANLDAAYMTQRESKFLFVAVQSEGKYNEDLHDSIIDLDIEMAKDEVAKTVMISTLLLPKAEPAAINAFLFHEFKVVHPLFKQPDHAI